MIATLIEVLVILFLLAGGWWTYEAMRAKEDEKRAKHWRRHEL